MEQSAYQVDKKDTVATALVQIFIGEVNLRGAKSNVITALTEIPKGHKIALSNIKPGEAIIKYGVAIGVAVVEIKKGSWVHLHNMKSAYDSRSSHLDVNTGVPMDIQYE
ncbi:hypothetical protein acsn021_08380 [Anaerocolumna cellulosilytica]|uniref:Uncharacterized protein n=1 Tax=Anaerocolumna cellulosilytica TaxID=433286 RepID=A0A6S6QW27_9FIRM|nr:UxaA family hydrolase [Anaerocolumna cellulosilytica]MBB5194326.1 altronate dehydratase [Anaerocolumna cellulosilytica]BCJ93269.1 hypothetical protein acsn021_08380 [Anaerocolumna cellulosilytica]